MADLNTKSSNPPAKAGSALPVLSPLIATINDRLHKSKQSLYMEALNPLWNMDANRAQQMYDWARRGNYALIQRLYDEVENCDPTFLTCVTRRCSALSELDWKIVRSDERFTRGADEGLVKEQIEFLETAIAKIDNMPDALEHFALSAFRGFSVCNTYFSPDGMPTHLECLDHWNICYDRVHNEWMWNPNASPFFEPNSDVRGDGITVLPKDDVIVVARKRQIDWPALMIFLRNAVGERDWGRCLETYGLPPVIITMPQFTSKEEQEAYIKAAEAVFEGRSGVIPYDSKVDFASEARGVNPFSDFIEHQMKLYVLLSTGGTLTSLSESGSGTLAGNAQMEVWKQITRADRRIVQNCFNKQLCEQLIKDCPDFKGKPILAEFQLDTTPQMTPDEVAELAGKFSNAGFEMDEKELSQIAGFTIRKKVESGGMGFNGKTPATTPLDGVSVPVPISAQPSALNAAEGAKDAEKPTPAVSTLAESLQDDFKAAADRINAILALPEADRAGAATKLLGELDTLIPDDPIMAEVIAEQMLAAFSKQIKQHPDGGTPLPNKLTY